jgi:hypothetical protein
MRERKHLKLGSLVILGIFVLYFLSLGPFFVLARYRYLPDQLSPLSNTYLRPANCIAAVPGVGAFMEF